MLLRRVPGGGVIATIDQAERAVELASQDAPVVQVEGDAGPRDPLDWGVKGAYPRLNDGWSRHQVLQWLRKAHNNTASARVLVNRVAADTWGEWVEWDAKDEALKQRIEDIMRNPEGRPGARPMWWRLERSDIFACRDGRSLLYFLLEDATGKPAEEPRRVRGIRHIQNITAERILGAIVDKEPRLPTGAPNPNFGRVTHWRIMMRAGEFGDAQGAGLIGWEVRVHAERVLAFIPEPLEDDENDGQSILWPLINYIAWDENFIWAVAEAYYQEARPLIYARRDPEAKVAVGEGSRENVKRAMQKIEDPNTQRVVLNGVIVEKLSGSGPTNPGPAWDVVVSHLAMALGIPRRVLTGDAAGELAAAKEDTRQYAGRISRRQEQYAGPILYGLLERLLKWEVMTWPRPAKLAVDFRWHPIVEQDAAEKADIGVKRMVTRTGYRRARLPLPEEEGYDDVAEWPRGTEELPEPGIFGSQRPGAPAAGDRRAHGDYAGPDDDGPFAVASRAEASMVRVLAKAKRAVAQLLAEKATGDARAESDALDRDVERLILSLGLDRELARIITEAMEEAAYEGAVGSFRDLGEERVFEYVDATHLRAFKTVGRGLGGSLQERLAEYVRREIADGLAEGEGTKDLVARLEHAFQLSRVDAARIARTETNRGYNVGTVEALRALGVTRVQFVAFPDADNNDPRGPCVQRNGQVFEVVTLLEADRPPIHPNCRCQLVALDGTGDVALYGVTYGRDVRWFLRRAQPVGVSR